MAKRIIMRVELNATAKRKFEETPDAWGMTQIAVTSKLVEWFLAQSEEVQASILGLYPKNDGIDLTTAILKHFINAPKRSR